MRHVQYFAYIHIQVYSRPILLTIVRYRSSLSYSHKFRLIEPSAPHVTFTHHLTSMVQFLRLWRHRSVEACRLLMERMDQALGWEAGSTL